LEESLFLPKSALPSVSFPSCDHLHVIAFLEDIFLLPKSTLLSEGLPCRQNHYCHAPKEFLPFPESVLRCKESPKFFAATITIAIPSRGKGMQMPAAHFRSYWIRYKFEFTKEQWVTPG
jgi:hypothetical protein